MKGLKIERAKIHLNEIDDILTSFFNSSPYKIAVKRNKENRPVYFVTDAKTVPIDVSLIAGEVIHNLRSELDHLAYTLYKQDNPDEEGKHIYFPIFKNKEAYVSGKDRKAAGINNNAIKIFDEIQPYKEGNDTLWKIHELNNIDKHRLLVTVGASFGSLNLGVTTNQFMKRTFPDQADKLPDLPPMFLKPADNLLPLKAGDELFIDLPDAEIAPNMDFRIDVVMYEPGIIESESVVNALKFMIEEVEIVTAKFDDILK